MNTNSTKYRVCGSKRSRFQSLILLSTPLYPLIACLFVRACPHSKRDGRELIPGRPRAIIGGSPQPAPVDLNSRLALCLSDSSPARESATTCLLLLLLLLLVLQLPLLPPFHLNTPLSIISSPAHPTTLFPFHISRHFTLSLLDDPIQARLVCLGPAHFVQPLEFRPLSTTATITITFDFRHPQSASHHPQPYPFCIITTESTTKSCITVSFSAPPTPLQRKHATGSTHLNFVSRTGAPPQIPSVTSET